MPTKPPYQPLVWAGTVAMVVLSFFLLASTKQTLNTATTTNTVSFSGQGKVLAKPDVAIIDMSILTESNTSKAAQDQNSLKSKLLTDFLKTHGVKEEDIKTSGYNIYPQYTYPRDGGKPTISGYQVNQSVQVKVRDLNNVDTILDGVVTAGVNQVTQLQLTIDDPDKLKEQAREAAIKDAEEKAGRLEDQLDIKLGRIVNFSESSDGYYPPIYFKDAMGGTGSAVPERGPSIPTGQNEVIVTVSITYQIK